MMTGRGRIAWAAGVWLVLLGVGVSCGPAPFEDRAHYYLRVSRGAWEPQWYSDDSNERAAIDRLGRLGAEATPVVPEMLKDIRKGVPYTRELIEAVGEIGPVTPEVVPTLAGVLAGASSSYTRTTAVKALGRMGPAALPAADALAKAASEGDLHDRLVAAFVLVKIGARRKEAIGPLVDELQAMLKPGRPWTSRQVQVLDTIARLQEKPDGGVGQLVEILDTADGKSEEAWSAADRIGELGAKAGPGIPALARAFRKPGASSRLRAAVIYAFAELGTRDPLAVGVFREGIDEKDDDVRRVAQKALAALGVDEMAVPGAAVVQTQPAAAAGKTLVLSLGHGVTMTLAPIPAGTFVMGSPKGEKGRFPKETQRAVTISRPFWMGVYEVTQEQWQAVMGGNPSWHKDPRHPVQNVGWYDAQAFCRKASAVTGRVVRLPTSAQWEYACRAGTTTAYNTGPTLSGKQANVSEEPGPWRPAAEDPSHSTPVGSFAPNAWGLYDMHGNVWEWCRDWFGSSEETESLDPQGPASGDKRIQRGGAWDWTTVVARSAYRHGARPDFSPVDCGFRVVVLDPPGPAAPAAGSETGKH